MAGNISSLVEYTCELNDVMEEQTIPHPFMEGDGNAHTFVITVKKGGQNADLTGVGVMGYFLRSDGVTVMKTGTVSGSTVTVVAPSDCYAVVGRLTVTVRISTSGAANTVYWGSTAVQDTQTSEVVQEGSYVPDIASVNAVVTEAGRVNAQAVQTASGATITITRRTGAQDVVYLTNGGSGGSVNWGNITGNISDNAALTSALNGKVSTVSGKGLSTNDYTSAEKNKLAGIEVGANAFTLEAASAELGGVCADTRNTSLHTQEVFIDGTNHKLYTAPGGGSGGTWSGITGKPFATVGDGLTVASDALKVDTVASAISGSTKPITSGAVYTLLGSVESQLAGI